MMWLADSRKAQVALGSILSIIAARFLSHWGFSESDINVITGGIVAISGVWMASMAHVDAATQSSGTQVNVQSDVKNQPKPTDAPHAPAPLETLTAAPDPIAELHRMLVAYEKAAKAREAAKPHDVVKGEMPH